jgi:hypothetical protein
MHRRQIISLIAALLVLTGCTNKPPAGAIAGYVTTDPNDPYTNRCAVDPIGDIGSLVVDPPYVEAYNSGKSPWGVWAPTGHDGDGLIHHEGVQRITRGGKNYFIVSDAVKTGYDPGIEIIELGSRGGTYEALGANVTIRSSPPHEDHVVYYLPFPFRLSHAGGIQVNGSYVIIPLEDYDSYQRTAGFTIADLSNPAAPRWGDIVWRTKGETTHAGDASLTHLSDGRFMALIFGNNSEDVEVFVTSKPDLYSSWISMAQIKTPDDFQAAGYQNVQFVTGCDGKLFVVATHDNTGEDWVDLWQVQFSPQYVPTFNKVAKRNVMCSSSNTGNERYCNFDAGGGSYVSVKGTVLVYGIEHYNDAPPGDSLAVKVREFSR